jgi:hypothetical protein
MPLALFFAAELQKEKMHSVVCISLTQSPILAVLLLPVCPLFAPV